MLDRPNGMNTWALFLEQLGLRRFHISFIFILMFLSFFCKSSGSLDSLPSLLKFEIFVLRSLSWQVWSRAEPVRFDA